MSALDTVIQDVSVQQPLTSFALPADDLRALTNVPPVDFQTLLEQCLGKPTFAISLTTEFAKSGHDRLTRIEQELALGNVGTVGEMAHALKGVAGVIAANTLAEVCSRLEAAGRETNSTRVHALVPQLRQEMQRVLEHIPILHDILERHLNR